MQFEAIYDGVLIVEPNFPGENFDHDDVIEAAIDRVTEKLIDRDWIIDPIVSGSIVKGEIRIIVTVAAAEPAQALGLIDSSVRAVLRAAEVHTPDWPTVQSIVKFECLRETTAEELLDA